MIIANSAQASCIYKDNKFQTTEQPSLSVSPIYRLYNIRTGAHVYTRSTTEANITLGKWNDFQFTDGYPAFCLPLAAQPSLTPIYRIYNKKTGVHVYARGEADRDLTMRTWPEFEFTDGVPAFYASLTPQNGLTPIYRIYNKKTGVHVYARGEADRDLTMRTWPEFEFTDGVPAFYASIATDAGPTLLKYAGPEIPIGLWYYEKSAIQDDPFEIEANKNYNIKDKDGSILAQINAGTRTKVTYDGDGYLEVYDSISSTKVKTSVTFDAADGDNASLIFDVHRPDSSYDDYRGKITVRYYKGGDIYNGNTSTTVTQIWVINTPPLEHYVWGMGETTGTGDIEHTKVMTTIFRTYGRWYIEYATKYLPLGFKIRSDAGSQIYRGNSWEKSYPNIKKAAEATRGSLATYGDEIALTPYSSWSDGRTRSYKERWGSSDYPWCKSVDDPYGEHPSKSTATLEAEGNHMVGLIANGSLELAGDHDWTYDKIMKYYYSGISLEPLY